MMAEPHKLVPVIRPAFGEMHFGEWEGKTFEALNGLDDWQRFNTARSMVQPPQGELMLDVQGRMVAEMEALRATHSADLVALVSHGDPLRSLLAYYLGTPLDLISRFVLSPSGVSVVQFPDGVPNVLCINAGDSLPI